MVPCVRKKADWALRWIEGSSRFAERLVAFAAQAFHVPAQPIGLAPRLVALPAAALGLRLGRAQVLLERLRRGAQRIQLLPQARDFRRV